MRFCANTDKPSHTMVIEVESNKQDERDEVVRENIAFESWVYVI